MSTKAQSSQSLMIDTLLNKSSTELLKSEMVV